MYLAVPRIARKRTVETALYRDAAKRSTPYCAVGMMSYNPDQHQDEEASFTPAEAERLFELKARFDAGSFDKDDPVPNPD